MKSILYRVVPVKVRSSVKAHEQIEKLAADSAIQKTITGTKRARGSK
jgi:hypothetical protein